MKVSEFTFDSSTAHNKIFTRLYEPDGEPKAVLQISHGMAEHSALYKPFCEYMAQRGFVVVINDHLGHAAGDEVLVQGATLLRRSMRLSDCVARMGGDEFVALLPGCSAAQARRIAGDIVYGLEACNSDVSIHSRPIRRLTPQPTERGRADCPSLKGGVTKKDFIGFAVLSTTFSP